MVTTAKVKISITSKMRRRDQIGPKYNLPSFLNVGHFTIKIYRSRKNRHKLKCPIFYFLEFFQNISDESKSLKFRLGGRGSKSSFTLNKKLVERIFWEFSYFRPLRVPLRHITWAILELCLAKFSC